MFEKLLKLEPPAAVVAQRSWKMSLPVAEERNVKCGPKTTRDKYYTQAVNKLYSQNHDPLHVLVLAQTDKC